MEDSTLYHNYHAKEGFASTTKRKARVDMNIPAVINLDAGDEMDCLRCSFLYGTGAVLKRSCHDKNNATYGSLSGHKACSGNRYQTETKANGVKRDETEEGSSHTPIKMPNEEQKEAFKSLLAKEIKRQVLDGLGETGHSQVQDLQVMDIEDVRSGVSTNATSREEKNENNHPRPYFVKVKLLATVCIPIFLQSAPQSSHQEQPLKQTHTKEGVEEKQARLDGLLHSKEFSMTNSSQSPLEHHRSQVESIKPRSVFKEQCNSQVLQEKVSPRISHVKNEEALCRVPLRGSIADAHYSTSNSCNIPKWRDIFDSKTGLFVNDFEVHDFDADKSEEDFIEGQIWALYDDKDGMPRHYARITEVHSVHPFDVRITWLEPKTHSMEALMCLTSGVSITCGAFKLREQQDPIKLTHVHHFSHVMKSQPGLESEILISPSKGEVWALYKDQIAFLCTSQRIGGRYELVQVVDKDRDSHTLTVVPLLKIGGFKTRFIQEQWPFKIGPKDFLKFSHQIPAYILKERPRAYLELDPSSTPKLYD